MIKTVVKYMPKDYTKTKNIKQSLFMTTENPWRVESVLS